MFLPVNAGPHKKAVAAAAPSSSRFIMTLLVVLMTVACLAGATSGILDDETNHMQPCPFNQLCRCSRGGPEVGMIFCEDIPLGDVPNGINNTKAFALNLRRNGLRRIEENLFHRTGLWRIDIRQNLLDRIQERTFAGLERSLGELILSANRILKVPSRALRNLDKLKILDLSNNQINEINREDFSGLDDSLVQLSLADNFIVTLQMDTFASFTRLERLDVRGNSIMTVAPLTSGTLKLTHFNLAENSLERIPFPALTQLRQLHTLNLGHNRISSTFDVFFQGRLNVDTLILDYNMIGPLPPFAFQNFQIVNKTFLNGNWIKEIDEDAFKDAKIRELSLVDNGLVDLDEKAFRGLESVLQRLDLGFNELKTIPDKIFDKFDFLKTLVLGDNPLSFEPEKLLSGFRYTLETLNLNGEFMGTVPVKQLTNIRNLRSMGLCGLDSSVSADDFEGFGAALEHLNLAKNKLKGISGNAFKHIPGINFLDLSENRISQIDSTAFDDIATSLTNLKMVNGLGLNSLSSEPFKKLRSLKKIDLSSNRVTQVAGDFFHAMRDLETINLQDNSIERITPLHFHNDYTPNVVNISLAFNHLGSLDTQTFVDLPELQIVDLASNKIVKVAKGAFQNIENLEAIYLEDNNIESISPEAFHNLPKLETLNLAYNKLTKMSFDWLDQVGTLSAIKLDISHNSIGQLSANRSGWAAYSSVRSLDLGHNKINFISRNYFEPIRSSLTHLVLRHNSLKNISRDIYSDMEHLLWLDFSNNQVQLVDSDAFANAKSLQVLLLDHNEISEIYQDMLSQSSSLLVVNLSYNKLRFLPDTLFHDTDLEVLDVSHNQINKIPEGCLSRVSATLRHFDISHNDLVTIHPDQFKKMTNLVFLDLSHNDITTLMDRGFANLNRLSFLDLSYNPVANMSDHIFDTLISSLGYLNLAKIGTVDPGDFHLAELISFNISHNNVESMPSDFFKRFANLKEFDISHCQLTELPESPWSTGSRLRALHLNGNQLTSITNGTLAGLKSLEYLNIGDLPLQTFEDGSLSQLTNLRHLAIGTYERVRNLDITRLMDYNQVVKHLEIIADGSSLDGQLKGKLPFKINNVTLSGEKLRTVSGEALKGLQGKSLTLNVRNTGLTDLPKALFKNLGNTRWLQLELRHNRLTSVNEPMSTIYPGTPNTVFLTHLQMSDNPWTCDCTVGWIEFWMRKWRQHYCKERCGSYYSIMRDLRKTTCKNRSNASLVTVLKNELECGWSAAPSVANRWQHWALIVVAGMTLIKQLNSLAS